MLLVFAAALVIKLNCFKVKLVRSCAVSDVCSTTDTLGCNEYYNLVIFYLNAVSV